MAEELSRVSRAVEKLKDGDVHVMEWLRAEIEKVHEVSPLINKAAALSNTITRIRNTMMQVLPTPSCDALRPFAGEDGVVEFCSLSLSEMVCVQRRHRKEKAWSEGAEAALASLELLPSNLASLKLSQEELLSLDHARNTSRQAKEAAVVHVHGAHQWLLYAIHLARTCTVNDSYARIALPILLLTGRRTAEVMNGKSTFLPTPRPTLCVFSGQLKKKGAAAPPYTIPLLCDIETVTHALGILREKQGYTQLENSVVNTRYAKSLNASTLFPMAKTVHTLRSMYASYVYRLYVCECVFNIAAMKSLGHDSDFVGLSYNAVVLHDAGCTGSCHAGCFTTCNGCLGPLP